MFSWFGKSRTTSSSSSRDTVNAPKDAIVKLRDMLVVLEKKEKHIQSKIDHEMIVAKENATKNKRVALMALKRKHQYEADLQKLNGTMSTLETQLLTIENANVNLEALKAMKAGSEVMKSIHGSINIEKVEETMDDIREQMDIANEVSKAISEPVGFGLDIDEDELDHELRELEQESLDEKLLYANDIPLKPIPAVPLKSAPIKQTEPSESDIDEELEQLRASMAL